MSTLVAALCMASAWQAPASTPLKISGVMAPATESFVTVPENYSQPRGRTIQLRIVILHAKEPTGAPLVVCQGGPGQAASDLAAFYGTAFRKFNQGSDIVLLDQRGTGGSNPLRLDWSGFPAAVSFEGRFPRAVLRRSLPKLLARADLAQYNSYNAVRDIERVREAFGWQKIRLYGTSYGTRVAQMYMEAHPDRVKAAVLKGVLPLGVAIGPTFAGDAQRALESVFAEVKGKPDYARLYPELEAKLRGVFRELAANPAKARVSHDGKTEEVSIDLDCFARSLQALLPNLRGRSQVPRVIDLAHRREWDTIAQLIFNHARSWRESVYDAMSLSVLCAEDSEAQWPLTSESSRREVEHAYRMWTGARLGPPRLPAKTIRPPVLLLSGTLDSVTPADRAATATRYLANSNHFLHPFAGHSFEGWEPYQDAISDFLDQGVYDRRAFARITPPDRRGFAPPSASTAG